jgi:hypothetical protein
VAAIVVVAVVAAALAPLVCADIDETIDRYAL